MIQPDTVVAISTPRGEGGIGIVRLSGPEALSLGQQIFRSHPPLGERVRYVEYGRIWAGGRAIDTGVAWVFAAPHSYTGEDTVEISCHGSMVVLESVVEEALRLGAVAAAPGEFTRRAFLNGRLDLLEAEAVIDLIQASSKAHLDNAYGLASGRLSKMVRELKGQLVKMLSLLEIGLDFSDEDIASIERQEIQVALREVVESSLRLAETFEGTRRRQEGYLVVLIGRPNVGKSTLLNVLLGEDRAIVTPLPGTTRDLVEGRTTWAGETIRLVDTAGIRQSHNLIEKEGIERASQAIGEADVVLAVFDSSTESHEDDMAVLDLLPSDKKSIGVFNKIDLPGADIRSKVEARVSVSVEISALREFGIEKLKREVTAQLPHGAEVDGIGITRQRHQDCLLRVAKSGAIAEELLKSGQPDECVVAELQDALNALGEILGEAIEEEVLDSIFSQFCIGK
ncbi:MAG: tRNA uridine-5-carboxymethylaminomethyl(34) synthesis GTPase MnmE [Gemmatimonadetes bacterium]|nr:tRNA uridine-5-carboxymethylaminomethyl(34) synthesis GTPase MnmE [Gemmatimonadota bacterium]